MKVSICIPAYRQIEYLRATLESIATQDFQDYELIVSDDSPDDSVRDLLATFDFGDRLRYVHNTPALGSPGNWNAAMRLARGEYVKIQHHDDHFLRPDALRLFVGMLDADPEADFAFAASLVQHVDSGLERIHRPTEQQLADLRANPAALFYGNCVGAPSATIVRKGLGLEYDSRMKWLVDLDYYYRALMLNPRFAYTPEVLIGTPTNATHQVTEICRDDASIEIGEALLLYEKFTPEQRVHPLVQKGWRLLFRRFRLRSLRDFERRGLPMPPAAEARYFRKLLNQPLTRWDLIFHPRLLAQKILYRLYPYLPELVRRPIKQYAARLRERRVP